jgi:hypothetical protein
MHDEFSFGRAAPLVPFELQLVQGTVGVAANDGGAPQIATEGRDTVASIVEHGGGVLSQLSHGHLAVREAVEDVVAQRRPHHAIDRDPRYLDEELVADALLFLPCHPEFVNEHHAVALRDRQFRRIGRPR